MCPELSPFPHPLVAHPLHPCNSADPVTMISFGSLLGVTESCRTGSMEGAGVSETIINFIIECMKKFLPLSIRVQIVPKDDTTCPET